MSSDHTLSGRRIGSYEIGALLGVGGMGEVYRAQDLRLGRSVAIKLLPPAFARDADRLARFEREARMLATLSHPNIGAIYGVEDADGQRALVLELVEGPTLADRIAPGAMSLNAALPIARQIADALDAAHERGIVHRDLKPANIKITSAGVVKVLDFGLAKHADSSSFATTVAGMQSGVGAIVGTPAYMSPEQARGEAVDKRTDIWAFGCVLFEMLSGRSPFGGRTITDTLAAIVDKEPDWSLVPAATPASVVQLLHRCLDKDQRRRLRDVGDARVELEPAPHAQAAAARVPAAASKSSRLPWIVSGLTSLVAVVAIVAAAAAWLPLGGAGRAASAPSFSRIVPLTAGPAREFGPTISPDGKWVAYISDDGGSPNVWVKFLAGGQLVNLTATAGLEISAASAIGGLEMHPDGSRIAVQANLQGLNLSNFSTYELPAPLPGPPRALLEPGFLGMRWSLDGAQMAFIRAGGSAGDALLVADGDGTNQRELVPPAGGAHMHWLAWGPDGLIYYMRPSMAGFNFPQTDIYRVNPRGGAPEPVIATSRRAMFPLPIPGGGMIYSADPNGVDTGLFWRGTDGSVERITFGLGEYAEPRISADGRALVATRYENRRSLVRIDVTGPAAGRMTPLTDGFAGDVEPSVVPTSSRMVFSSARSGNWNIWTANTDASDPRPLTSGPAWDQRPAISPDGKTVAFVSDRGGKTGIWTIAAAGGAPRKLVDVVPVSALSWSPDSGTILYAAASGTWPGLWVVDVRSAQVKPIAVPGAAGEPAWSPTGGTIAYLEIATSGPTFHGLSLVAPDGNAASRRALKAPPGTNGFGNGLVAWAPDGRRLALARQNTNAPTSVWIADPDSPTPFRKLVDFPVGPRIRGITWVTNDALIVGQYDNRGDIVLFERED